MTGLQPAAGAATGRDAQGQGSGPPGAAGQRHLAGRSARLGSPSHRAGRRVPDRHRAAAAGPPRASLMPRRRNAVDTKNLVNYFRLTPGQPPAVRRAGAVCRLQPRLRREERRDPARGDGPTSFPSWRGPHRLLLGRDGRHDARPPAPRRRAERHLLLHGLQRAWHADVDADGHASWPRSWTGAPS